MEVILHRKCLFCLEVIVKTEDEDGTCKMVGPLRSLQAIECFQLYSSYLQNLVMDAPDEATYCSKCYEKVTEIRLVQKNITNLQNQLRDLASGLEDYVIEKYKSYHDQTQKGPQSYEQQENVLENLDDYMEDAEINVSCEPVIQVPTTRARSTRSRKRKARTVKINGQFLHDLPLPQNSFSNDVGQEEPDDGGKFKERQDVDEDYKPPTRTTKTRRREMKTRASSSQKEELRCTHSGCRQIFSTEKLRSAHAVEHKGHQKNYQCSICNRSFSKAHNLDTHIKWVHDTPKDPMEKQKSFPCTVDGCNRSFSLESMQFCHIKKFHEGVVAFKCSYCDKEYAKPSKLKAHIRSHTGEVPFACPTCGKGFTTKSYLRQHMAIHSDKFACEICGKPCSTRQSLEYHINTHNPVDSSVKPFFCELCGYTCSTKQYLDRHQANQHEGKTELEAIKCPVCTKYLSTKKSLESHLLSIHKIGEAKFRCEKCQFSTNIPRELRVHIDHVHLNIKKHECLTCHKMFSNRAGLRTHIQRHHVAKEDRERPFECSICYKRFFVKKTLENHEAIHGSARPFPCGQCNQRFPTKNYLHLHKFTIHDKRQTKKRNPADTEVENNSESSVQTVSTGMQAGIFGN